MENRFKKHILKKKVPEGFIPLTSTIANKCSVHSLCINDLANIKEAALLLLKIGIGEGNVLATHFELKEDIIIRNSLFVFIIVTYGKFFKSSELPGRMVLNRSHHLSEANEEQLVLHDYLIDLRDKYIAHGGINTAEACIPGIRVGIDKEQDISYRVEYEISRQFGLKKEQLDLLPQLIEIIKGHVHKKQLQLEEKLYSEVSEHDFEYWLDKWVDSHID